MTFFQNTTDASNMYIPNSAAGSNDLNGSAVSGNLSDVMKNGAIYRVTYVAPIFLSNNDLKPTSVSPDCS